MMKMNNTTPYIIAKVKFYETNNNGRKGPYDREWYACPLVFQNQENYFDCRMYLENGNIIYPGDEKILTIKFLDPETIFTFLKVNDVFKIWEGGFIGEGQVLEIYS